jgi:hypothetical protein
VGKVGKIVGGVVLLGGAIALGAVTGGAAVPYVLALGSLGTQLALSGLRPIPSFKATNANAQPVNVVSPIASLPVVYGEARIGVRLVDLRQDTDASLFVVAALCHGSADGTGIEAVREIYFNDQLAVNAAGVVQAPFVGSLTVTTYLGSSTQTADATLVSRFPSAWGVAARGRGVAYLVLRLVYNPTVYPSGLPTITATVRGVRLFDPRTGTSSYPGADCNPALAIRDYLTSVPYGAGALTSEIHDASVIAAANYADAAVTNPNGGTWARFRAAGVVDTQASVSGTLTGLLTSCRGALVWQGGQYRLVIRQAQSPVAFALTEDVIVGGLTVVLPGMKDRKNLLRGAIVDPTQNYQVREVPWPRVGASNAYLTEDNGFENLASMELPFTADLYRAEQLLDVNLRETRAGIAVQLRALEAAYVLEVGDVVNVTHSTPGWVAKPFWVLGIAPQPDRTITILLGEYDATCYGVPTLSLISGAPSTTRPDIDEIHDRVAGTITGVGVLTPGTGGDDGTGAKSLQKGYQSGTARHGDIVTFGSAYQSPPVVRITGGATSQPAALWGTIAQVNAGTAASARAAAAEIEASTALGLTASGFEVRALLRQPGTSTARTNDFSAGHALTAAGQSIAVTLANAPSFDDQYRTRGRSEWTFTARAGAVQSAVITILIQSSADAGSSWTTRATVTHTIDDDNTGGDSTGSFSTIDFDETLAVASLDSTDQIRIRIEGIVRGTLSTLTGSVKGYGATGLPTGGVTYTTQTGGQFASKTPTVADTILWEAWTNG